MLRITRWYTEAMENQQEAIARSRRRAAAAVLCVTVFAAAFIGVACFLHASSPKYSPNELGSQLAPTSDPLYVLLIGSDSRKGTALYTGKANEHAQVDQHSDIMTLMRIDPETYTITLVTVPRDTQLAGTSGKINDALAGGDPNEVVKVVETLTGITVDYYMMTTFTSFESLVDDLGGTVVDVPLKITTDDPSTGRDVTVAPGQSQSLDGSQTLVLARARKEYVEDQDALRQVNVRNIEVSLIEKVLANPGGIDDALLYLEEHTTTNMDFGLVASLAADFLLHRDDVTIYTCTGPHKGSVNEAGLWVIPEDKETWSLLMETVYAGEDPSGVVSLPSFPVS